MARILSEPQWMEILSDTKFLRPLTLRILQIIYSKPGHKAPASEVGSELGKKVITLSSEIKNFVNEIRKHYNLELTLRDDGTEKRWDIPFNSEQSFSNDGTFPWELRKELTRALEKLGLTSPPTKIRNTFLYAWNPSRYPWEIDKAKQIIDVEGFYREPWLSSRKNVNENDRIFIVRLGSAHTGIVASGFIDGPAFFSADNIEGKNRRLVPIRFDNIQDLGEEYITLNELREFGRMNWTPQTGGVIVNPGISSKIEKRWDEIITGNALQIGASSISNLSLPRNYALSIKNWPDGGNNYTLKASAANKWTGFQDSVISKLTDSFGDDFNIIIYSDEQIENDYYCIPFRVLKHLFIPEHKTTGKYPNRWTAIISDDIFRMHSNSELSVDISPYYSVPLIDRVNIEVEEDFYIENAKAEINIRLGQSKFRKGVLSNFGNKCALTGISEQTLLTASHIIPWSHDKSCRGDISNGISLYVEVDALFDKGYISFTDDLKIIVTSNKSNLSDVLLEKLEKLNNRRLNPPSKIELNRKYLDYHRSKILKK
jgi:putative restriction endonuclease